MRGARWRWVGAACALALVGCRAPSNPSPPAAPASTASVVIAPVPGPFASVAPADLQSEWTPRRRFEIPIDEDYVEGQNCFPGIEGIAPLPDGTAWVAGGCGLRLRLDPDGNYANYASKWEARLFERESKPSCCPALPHYLAVDAREPNRVIAIGTIGCGGDPGAQWQLPLERYEGDGWARTNATLQETLYDGVLDELAVAGPVTYALTLGGPPNGEHCGLYRLNEPGERWTPFRMCQQAQDSREKFRAMAVDATGRPWLAGSRQTAQGLRGTIWFLQGNDWIEESPGGTELVAISVAPDGAVWLGSQGAATVQVRTGPSEYREVTLPEGFKVNSLWAHSSSEAWVGGNMLVLHVSSRNVEPFSLAPDDRFAQWTVKGAGTSVWATTLYETWEFTRSKGSLPVVERAPEGSTDAEWEAVAKALRVRGRVRSCIVPR